MLLILVPIFFLLFALLVALLIMSPGKPKPYLDKNGEPLSGSISEKVFIEINNTKQGMFIKGRDVSKPILLYLHGGMPEYFLSEKYPSVLDDLFVVVWWEQRGSGISYNADIPSETITLDQMKADTVEITKYLRRRFKRDKIYLLGHSGGTFIGIQVAAENPELYYAYLGVAQMSNQLESERLAYTYMLRQFKANGNRVMSQKLESAPVTARDVPSTYLAVRDQAMHRLGVGTTRDMKSVLTGIVLPSFVSTSYTLTEKINMWRGKSQSGVSRLWDNMLATDLTQQVPKLDIPVYFFEGKYDYTCSFALAKSYFDVLQSPHKRFYGFEQSAHSPLFEESLRFKQILQDDVLAYRPTL